MMEEDEKLPGIQAYHGSPHDFDQFDLSKIGTGEGAQAFGHGLYFAESEPIAQHYRDTLIKGAQNLNIDGRPFSEHYTSVDPVNRLKAKVALAVREGRNVNDAIDYVKQQAEGQLTSRRLESENKAALLEDLQALKRLKQKPPQITENPGHMYEVNIAAHPDHFLDWDKPLQDQPYVMQKLIEAGAIHPNGNLTFMYNEAPSSGGEMYERLTSPMAKKLTGGQSQKTASEFLNKIGIKGIKYLDAASRSKEDGSRNHVVFDDKLVNVKRKYEDGGAVN